MKKILLALALFALPVWGQTISSPDSTAIKGLAVQNNGTVWAATKGRSLVEPNCLFFSTDNGGTWHFFYSDQWTDSVHSIGVTDSLVFVSGSNTSVSVYRISTGKHTGDPTQMPTGLPPNSAFFASNGSSIAAYSNTSVFTSTDEGFTWKQHLLNIFSTQAYAYGTGFAVTDSGYFIAYSSSDSPASTVQWSHVMFARNLTDSIGLSNISASFDSLTSWTDNYQRWGSSTQLFASGDTVYALVDTGLNSTKGPSFWKAYYTIDRAKSWQPATSLPSNVSAIAYGLVRPLGALHKSSSTNYQAIRAIGTTDGKVYIGYSTISAITLPHGVPTKFSLSQNYPNPFNPTTTIEYTLDKPEFVNLIVYNVIGQKVASLVSSSQSAGSHEASFDGSKFASGVYFYRLASNEYVDTKKMVLVK